MKLRLYEAALNATKSCFFIGPSSADKLGACKGLFFTEILKPAQTIVMMTFCCRKRILSEEIASVV